MRDKDAATQKTLLQQAETSLALHVALHPDSPHGPKLRQLYDHIRSNAVPPHGFPTARHLYWDAPETDDERGYFEDVAKLSQFVPGIR